jgi:hypothetical protein
LKYKNILDKPVAVSELLRTKQTAEIAGFKTININPLLNEVNTPDPVHTKELIKQKILPEEALAAAKALLSNPPKEGVWVTHGLVIAALEQLLKIQAPAFIADFCEIRELPI